MAEVASSLGVTANNATVRLHRARRALKRELERSCTSARRMDVWIADVARVSRRAPAPGTATSIERGSQRGSDSRDGSTRKAEARPFRSHRRLSVFAKLNEGCRRAFGRGHNFDGGGRTPPRATPSVEGPPSGSRPEHSVEVCLGDVQLLERVYVFAPGIESPAANQ